MTRPIKFRAWDGKEMFIPEGHALTKEGYLMIIGCEVMQFTGLHDKNGKEIYEGDVVESPHKEIGVVFWDSENTCYVLSQSEDILDGYWAGGLQEGNWKVIGNIYENPDLLTKE